MAGRRTMAAVSTQKGRRVVITGGSGGIGLQTAKAFAALGADVVIAARDEQRSSDAVQEVMAVSDGDPSRSSWWTSRRWPRSMPSRPG